MPRRKIPEDIQERVHQRSRYLCEYCHAWEQWQYVRFTVDHVVPIALGGTDNFENLALACFHCNRRKADRVNVTSESGESIPLFNPRKDSWQDHFIWSGDRLSIVGLTPTGNATIEALALNRERVKNIRSADRDIGRHPPPDDPMQTE